MSEELDEAGQLKTEIERLRRRLSYYNDSYLSQRQVDFLLSPINPNRVKFREGMSYLEPHDVRRALIGIFGLARWSFDVLEEELVFEDVFDDPKRGDRRVSCGWKVRGRLTIFAADGIEMATYTEASFDAKTNYPINKRGEAHDHAIKGAASGALKRCAINLGDQLGLGLYNGGKTDPFASRTLHYPFEHSSPAGVPSQAGEEPEVHAEPEVPAEPEPDPRTMNSPPSDASKDTEPEAEPSARGEASVEAECLGCLREIDIVNGATTPGHDVSHTHPDVPRTAVQIVAAALRLRGSDPTSQLQDLHKLMTRASLPQFKDARGEVEGNQMTVRAFVVQELGRARQVLSHEHDKQLKITGDEQ